MDPAKGRQQQPSVRAGRSNPTRGKGGVGGDRGSTQQQVVRELQLEMMGRVICPDVCPNTPKHMNEFDGLYMVPYSEDVQERMPQDTKQRQRTGYQN